MRKFLPLLLLVAACDPNFDMCQFARCNDAGKIDPCLVFQCKDASVAGASEAGQGGAGSSAGQGGAGMDAGVAGRAGSAGLSAGSGGNAGQTQGGAGASGSAGSAAGTGGSPSTTMQLGTNFWYLATWSGQTTYVSGVNWPTAYTSGANIWNPAFVAELAPYSVLRFMDWGNTNHSQLTSWSQRRLPTDPGNATIYIDAQSAPPNPGLAYEWMIDLCNRTGKDMWVTVPARVDADFQTQLATLIKSKLAPTRKMYIEYSNETWNGAFGQNAYMISQGQALGLPGANQWYKGGAYSVYRSLQLFKAFSDVFGNEKAARVVNVYAYGGNLDIGRQALTTVYGSPMWNPSGQKIDMLAVAPYVGNGADGTTITAAGWLNLLNTRETGEDGIVFAKADRCPWRVRRRATSAGELCDMELEPAHLQCLHSDAGSVESVPDSFRPLRTYRPTYERKRPVFLGCS